MSSLPDPDFLARLHEIPDPAGSGPERSELEPPRLPQAATRKLVRGRRLAALLGGLAWLAVHLVVYGVRTDLNGLPLTYVAAQILLPVALATGSLFAAFGRGKRGLGYKTGLISALALLGPASFGLIALGAPAPRRPEPGTLLDTLLCFDLTLVWVLVPLLCAAITVLGAFAAAARWRSALVGAGIGLFAGATMNLHCPNVAPAHVLLGHGIPVVVAALLGAFVLVLRARA